MTTICGTDVHILRGEYPVAPGRIVGHEPVGVIHELGSAVEGYAVGDRVLVGATRPAAAASIASTAPVPSAPVTTCLKRCRKLMRYGM
jgi:threonine dehydrogenase-like Zn-dependent dehydrogenase